MRISIVLPIYNYDLNLFEICLQSIKHQIYKDWELIISDDSPEFSILNNLENLLGLFDRNKVKYVVNPGNKGIFFNLNNALKYTEGDLIHFLCQDDYLKNNFLISQVNLFLKYSDVGLVFSAYEAEDKFNNKIPIGSQIEVLHQVFPEFIVKSKAINYLFAFGSIPRNLSPVTIRRTVLDKVGFFNPNLPYVSDFQYWIKTAEKFNFGYNRERNIVLRSHSSRASNTLGQGALIKDAIYLYKYLHEINTVNCTEQKKKVAVNYMCGWHFKAVLVSFLSGKYEDFKLFFLFRGYPINIFLTFYFFLKSFIFPFKWIINEKDC